MGVNAGSIGDHAVSCRIIQDHERTYNIMQNHAGLCKIHTGSFRISKNVQDCEGLYTAKQYHEDNLLACKNMQNHAGEYKLAVKQMLKVM